MKHSPFITHLIKGGKLAVQALNKAEKRRSELLALLPDTVKVSQSIPGIVADVLAKHSIPVEALQTHTIKVCGGEMRLGRYLAKLGESPMMVRIVLGTRLSVEVSILKSFEDILLMSSKRRCNYTSCHSPAGCYFDSAIAKALDPRAFLAVVYGNNGKISWRTFGYLDGTSIAICTRTYGDESVCLNVGDLLRSMGFEPHLAEVPATWYEPYQDNGWVGSTINDTLGKKSKGSHPISIYGDGKTRVALSEKEMAMLPAVIPSRGLLVFNGVSSRGLRRRQPQDPAPYSATVVGRVCIPYFPYTMVEVEGSEIGYKVTLCRLSRRYQFTLPYTEGKGFITGHIPISELGLPEIK